MDLSCDKEILKLIRGLSEEENSTFEFLAMLYMSEEEIFLNIQENDEGFEFFNLNLKKLKEFSEKFPILCYCCLYTDKEICIRVNEAAIYTDYHIIKELEINGNYKELFKSRYELYLKSIILFKSELAGSFANLKYYVENTTKTFGVTEEQATKEFFDITYNEKKLTRKKSKNSIGKFKEMYDLAKKEVEKIT